VAWLGLRVAKSRRNAEEASRIVYEVEGIVCAAIAAVLALSFASYVPDLPARNQVGPLGHWLANLLVEAFGLAAYLFPAVLGLGALALFANVAGMTSPVRMLGAFAVLIEAAVALGLFRTGVASERAGGWVGGFLATVMRDALGASGSTVVLGAAGLLIWLMVTATPLSTVAGAVKGQTSGLFGAVGPRMAELLASLLRRSWGALPRFRRGPEIATDAKPARKRAAKVESDDAPVVFGDGDLVPAPTRTEPLVQISQPESKSKKKSAKDASQEEFSFALECDDYKLPPPRLLGKSDDPTEYADEKTLVAQSKVLEQKLATFGVSGRVVAVRPGPVITTFEFEPDAGIKVSRVVNLCDDLTMALRAHGVRIVAPIPGKNVVGIEVSNRNRAIVGLRDLIDSDDFRRSRSALTLALGRNTTGMSTYTDLAKMPHLLMAGATGTGKSVALNAMIVSMLYKATPRDVRFIMIDPKMLELALYEGIPHLLVPVVTDVRKAAAALANVMREMDRRFERMKDLQVRSIDDYNARVAEMDDEDEDYDDEEEFEIDEEELEEGDGDEEYEDDEVYEDEEYEEEGDEDGDEGEGEGEGEGEESEKLGGDEDDDYDQEEEASASAAVDEAPKHEHLPRIVVIVDELADLMMTVGREVEQSITRLAQKARAAGIHLIVATQRPSVDVITGLIKANFPSRVSFKVTARPDSRTILDAIGAEQLLGNGDMLYKAPGAAFMQRLHGAYITDREITEIVKFLRKQGDPEYMMDLLEAPSTDADGEAGEDLNDELYDKAVDLVIEHGQGSTSWIQRKLNIGYNRAARMMEEMERQGVVGPADGARPRKVLVGPHASV
jgi:S-DNA-T family DNA segregation ATPase FtsK/SpoIIIE